MEYWRTFFPQKATPLSKTGGRLRDATTIPMSIAKTGPPTTGTALPRNQEGMAMSNARPTP